MPLAKLSERFYEKFGHDLVEELVGWLNQMDTTYRTDLRELNELNFARFDAKLEQRIAAVRTELATLRGEFREALEAQTAKLLKWMLGIWIATVPTAAGVVALIEHFVARHP